MVELTYNYHMDIIFTGIHKTIPKKYTIDYDYRIDRDIGLTATATAVKYPL